MRRRDVFLYVILGIVLGVAVIIALNVLFGRPTNGCPNANTRSTDTPQVFLMGTIGGDWSDSERDCWREYIVQPVLDELGVTYFNPVVENWTEEDAEREAKAIAHAETIVLVITAEHPSIGSLSESGWAVLSAEEREQRVIVFIADDSDDVDSARARKIVLSQARPLAQTLDTLILVDSLDAVPYELRRLYER